MQWIYAGLEPSFANSACEGISAWQMMSTMGESPDSLKSLEVIYDFTGSNL